MKQYVSWYINKLGINRKVHLLKRMKKMLKIMFKLPFRVTIGSILNLNRLKLGRIRTLTLPTFNADDELG